MKSIGLTSIRMFVAAYEEGTFTEAAERENATQSGVSQHMTMLEHALGVRLFTRSKIGVSPTLAAQSFYAHCLEMLRIYNEAMRSTKSFGMGLEGEITVGLMPTLTRVTLAPVIERFARENANVRVLIVEGFSGFLTERVLSGELDLAITPSFVAPSKLSSNFFASVPEVLISSRTSNADRSAPVILRNAPPLKLIVPSGSNTRRHNIETYCAAHGGRIDKLLELDSISATLDLIARSDWQSILPLPVAIAPSDENRFDVRPIAQPSLFLNMTVLTRAAHTLSPAAELFCDMLAQSVASHIEAWQTRNNFESVENISASQKQLP